MLLSISGGSDLGLFEIHEAARLVQEAAHPDANIIFGAVIDDALGDEVRVTVIAAGFDGGEPKPRTKPFRGVEDLPAPAQALTPAVDNAGRVPTAGATPPRSRCRGRQRDRVGPLPAEPARVRRPIVFDDTSAAERRPGRSRLPEVGSGGWSNVARWAVTDRWQVAGLDAGTSLRAL